MFNLYSRAQQWNIACGEVSKLNVGRGLLRGLLAGAAPNLGAEESISVEKVGASGGTRTLPRRHKTQMSRVALQSSR